MRHSKLNNGIFLKTQKAPVNNRSFLINIFISQKYYSESASSAVAVSFAGITICPL